MKKAKYYPDKLREILIKRSTSINGKRRYLLMTEMIEKDGVLAKAQKKYYYFVSRTQRVFNDKATMKSWMDKKDKILKEKPRHVSITREFDQDTGLGNTTCRTTGSFYIIKKQSVFAVAFLHSVKFDVIGSLT